VGSKQRRSLPPHEQLGAVAPLDHDPARLVAPGHLAANGIGSTPGRWPQHRHAQAAPKACGAGGSRAPAPGMRKRCMDRGLHAVACPTASMARLAGGSRQGKAAGHGNGTRSVGQPCAPIQQLTPVSRSAAYRPLAARVMKGADCERRGTASAALTVGSRRFVKHRTLAASGACSCLARSHRVENSLAVRSGDSRECKGTANALMRLER